MSDLEARLTRLEAVLAKVKGEFSRHGFTGQASRGESTPAIMNGGLLRRGFVARGAAGSTTSTGGAGTLPAPSAPKWKTALFPTAPIRIDRTKPFPHTVLANVRRDLLDDPLHKVGLIEVIDV